MLELNKVYKTNHTDRTVRIVYVGLKTANPTNNNLGVVTQTNKEGMIQEWANYFSDDGNKYNKNFHLIIPKKIKEGDTVKSKSNTTVHIIKIVDGFVYGWFIHAGSTAPVMGKWAEHNGNPVWTACYSVGSISTTVDE